MLKKMTSFTIGVMLVLLAGCGGNSGGGSETVNTTPDVDKFAEAREALFNGGEYMLGMSNVLWEGTSLSEQALAAMLNSDALVTAEFNRFATKLSALVSTDVTRKAVESDDFLSKITKASCQASGEFTYQFNQAITTSGNEYSVDSITFCVEVNGETNDINTAGDAVAVDNVWATATVRDITNSTTEEVTLKAGNKNVTSDSTAYPGSSFVRTGVAKKMGGKILVDLNYPTSSSIEFCSSASTIIDPTVSGNVPSSIGTYLQLLCNSSDINLLSAYSRIGLGKNAVDSSTGLQYLNVEYHTMAGGNLGEVPKASNEIVTYYFDDIELTAGDGRLITLTKVHMTMNGSSGADTVNDVKLSFEMVFSLTADEVLNSTPDYDVVPVVIDPADDAV